MIYQIKFSEEALKDIERQKKVEVLKISKLFF
jgi:hypothetical protein